jgi:DNA-binding NarL/FixJ family response regulator
MSSESNTLQSSSASLEESPQSIRVILADSQAIYRVGMRKVFAVEDDIRVVAQTETLDNLYSALDRFPEGVVILEGQLVPDLNVMIPEIVERAPKTKFIVQVTEVDENDTVGLYRSGVKGVVARSILPDQLVHCVRRIAAGETWIDNQSISWVLDAYRAQAAALMNPRTQPKLSSKELTIIGCITRGMRNKEIATQIGTTEQVVKNYLRKIYDKLGVSDRLELALYCLHHQILKQDPESAEAAEALVQPPR